MPLMKIFLLFAALLLTSTISRAEFSLEQQEAFGKQLKGYFAAKALVPLYNRIGYHDIWMYETIDHLHDAGIATQIDTPKIAGVYVSRGKPPFFAFVYDHMQKQSEESRQRVVAHEMMHALDREVLKVATSSEFKAQLDKDMDNVKKIQSKATGEQHKLNAKILQYFAYYLAAPEEVWAEVAARVIFPPSHTKNRDNFEKILKNVFVYVRAKLASEGIFPPRASAPAPVVADPAPTTPALVTNPASTFRSIPFTVHPVVPAPAPAAVAVEPRSE
jgi:hypothetical protein